jgi:GT2 family glycosyltransferase
MITAPRTLPGNVQTVPLRQIRRPRKRIAATLRLTVVIVNYHQWENTAALTRQLRSSRCLRNGAAEIVIVDNHSPPNPLAGRLRRRPGVSLRRWGRNRGFARAVNEGCRLGQGEWLLLLNPDMTVAASFPDEILTLTERVTAAEPQTGIIGFALRNSDGTAQHSCGSFPTLWRTLTGLALPRSRRKYQALPVGPRCQVDWVTGCCLLVRRSCLESLGGLDEDYFLYYEDVDLCRRARARGWSVWYEPAQSAIHHNPLHARAVPPALRLITRHSLLTYGLKHWPRWQVRVLAGIVRLESWARQALAWWRGDSRSGSLFRELRALAADLAGGRPCHSRRRLLHVTAGEPLY